MRIKQTSLIILAVTTLLLTGCASESPKDVAKAEVTHCMNSFLKFAAANYPDAVDPESKDFDKIIEGIEDKCKASQKADPAAFSEMYGATESDTSE